MEGTQKELPLPFPEFSGDLPLFPVRMLNEFPYCPRLAYLAQKGKGQTPQSPGPSNAS